MTISRPITRSILSPLTRAVTAGGGGFSPLSLFAAGEPGAWYDPSDFATLFQDSAGTTPVTAAGQPVGKILDKSGRNNHATQATAASRPTLQQDASGLYCLRFDGVDDFMTITGGGLSATTATVVVGMKSAAAGATGDLWGNKSGNTGYRLQANPTGTEGFAVGNGGAFSTATASLAASTAGVLSGQYSGTTASIRVNGVLGTPATVTASAGSANAALGRAQDFAGSYFAGDLYQLIARGADTSATQLNGAERFCAGKSGAAF